MVIVQHGKEPSRPSSRAARTRPANNPEVIRVKKEDFAPHTRYTITWRDPQGKLRPANIYPYRLYDQFMVARMTDQSGMLRKFAYADIVKIVKVVPVAKENQFYIPEAVLSEGTWAGRTSMERYSSSPHMGK